MRLKPTIPEIVLAIIVLVLLTSGNEENDGSASSVYEYSEFTRNGSLWAERCEIVDGQAVSCTQWDVDYWSVINAERAYNKERWSRLPDDY